MIARSLAAVLLALAAHVSQAQGYADEDRDWGVAAQSLLRRAPYSAPTPTAIPGARAVATEELRRLASPQGGMVLIDVASGENHVTLAGALWWPGVGHGVNFVDVVQGEMARRLEQATGGDKARPLAFFCVNSRCWLSYNASLRAAALGYTNVLWYRGGIEAWRDAGLALGRAAEPFAAAAPLEVKEGAAAPR